jgi:hypothetical protein
VLELGSIVVGTTRTARIHLRSTAAVHSYLSGVRIVPPGGAFSSVVTSDGTTIATTDISFDRPVIIESYDATTDSPQVSVDVSFAPVLSGVVTASLILESDAANFEYSEGESSYGTLTLGLVATGTE